MPPPAPLFLAEVDPGGLIGVIVAVLYGVYWLFRRLAESREERAARERPSDEGAAQRDEEPEKEKEVYAADDQALRRFLESLSGVPAAPPPAPKPQPVPAPYGAPARPRQHPRPVPRPIPEGEGESVAHTLVTPAEGPPMAAELAPLPPPPAPVPLSQSVPSMEVTRSRGSTAVAAGRAMGAPQPAGERLAFPLLSPVQRAVILSEILPPRHPGRRPRLPRV